METVVLKKINNFLYTHRYIIIFSIFLSFLCYGMLLYPHWSHDTYQKAYEWKDMTMNGWLDFVKILSLNGRYTYGIMLFFQYLLSQITVLNNFYSNLFSIILFSILIIQSYLLLNKNICKFQRIILFLSIALLFLNPLFVDWAIFPECLPYYLLGIFICQLSVKFYLKNTWKDYIFSMLLFLLAIGTYQPIATYFVFFVLLGIWKQVVVCFREKGQYEFLGVTLLKTIVAFSIYLLGSLFQLFIVSILGKISRVDTDFPENIKIVIKAQKELWLMQTTGKSSILYLFFALVSLFVFICILTFILRKKRKRNKRSLLLLLIGVVFCMAMYIAIFASHIVVEPWVSQRTVTPFLGFIPFVIALEVMAIDKDIWSMVNIRLKISKNILIAIMGVMVCAYIYRSENLQIDIFKGNIADAQIAYQIYDIIQQYEENTTTQVKKIACRYDNSPSWSYPGTFAMYDMNVRAWTKIWAVPGIMYWYTGRCFEQVDMDEEIYNNNFLDKDWNVYSEEQIFIDGDTINIMIY